MVINIKKIHRFIVMLLMISIYFSRFNFNVGFSIKPYMIIALVYCIIFFRSIKFSKITLLEKVIVAFILMYSLTGLRFAYPMEHLRYIILFLIVLIFYFLCRSIWSIYEIKDIEKMISISGFIGSLASLIYYFIGMVNIGFNFKGNGIINTGILLDRSMPRLIGTVGTDPNIFVFFLSLYFFYTLNNLNTKLNRFGLCISGITIILTVSRGGFIGILIPIIISIIIGKGKIKKISIICLACMGVIIVGNILSFDMVQLIQDRFSGIVSDSGSGRLTLWGNALNSFAQYPIFGIGINSTRNFGIQHYGNDRYVHNTLIEVLSEAGIVGFMLFILIWIVAFYHCIKLSRKRKENQFLLMTFISMFIQMNFLSILYSEMFYLFLSLLWRYSVERDKN